MVGGAIGLLSAVSDTAWKVVRPICDMLQTIPLFVFLIPVLMVFQIGEASAFLAICANAVVPMIRYTRHGLVNTPDEMMEAAIASGATEWQILRDIRAPYAVPPILLALNQTILYAFAILVIAALSGTTDLSQSIYLALGAGGCGSGHLGRRSHGHPRAGRLSYGAGLCRGAQTGAGAVIRLPRLDK